eukprot:359151-Amphidinium_carterae.3
MKASSIQCRDQSLRKILCSRSLNISDSSHVMSRVLCCSHVRVRLRDRLSCLIWIGLWACCVATWFTGASAGVSKISGKLRPSMSSVDSCPQSSAAFIESDSHLSDQALRALSTSPAPGVLTACKSGPNGRGSMQLLRHAELDSSPLATVSLRALCDCATYRTMRGEAPRSVFLCMQEVATQLRAHIDMVNGSPGNVSVLSGVLGSESFKCVNKLASERPSSQIRDFHGFHVEVPYATNLLPLVYGMPVVNGSEHLACESFILGSVWVRNTVLASALAKLRSMQVSSTKGL